MWCPKITNHFVIEMIDFEEKQKKDITLKSITNYKDMDMTENQLTLMNMVDKFCKYKRSGKFVNQ